MKEDLKKLLKNCGAIKTGEFTLSSGKKSDFYVDAKQSTCHPMGLPLIANLIIEKLGLIRVNAVGGPTLGADPIVAAITAISGEYPCFIVRKEAKEHGLMKEIEGIIKPGWNVAIIEDVVTSGKSILQSIAIVEKFRCNVVKVICVVDREEGGAEALKNYDFDPIFKKSELL